MSRLDAWTLSLRLWTPSHKENLANTSAAFKAESIATFKAALANPWSILTD